MATECFENNVVRSRLLNRGLSLFPPALSFHRSVNAGKTEVDVKDGIVTLRGHAVSQAQKELTTEYAKDVGGVKDVKNEMTVTKTSKKAPQKTDACLMMKVKTTLLFHHSVSGFKTEVNVKDGIVTLRGEATSQAQKDLTTEYAKDVEGVKEVKNEMTVSKTSKKTQTVGEKIDDASITAQVKMTLLYHRSTSALNTNVKTKNGVVTLRGKAKNAAEKKLATKFVNDVKGVKSVNNQMTIE